jgi:hypothetical protein
VRRESEARQGLNLEDHLQKGDLHKMLFDARKTSIGLPAVREASKNDADAHAFSNSTR